MADEYLFHYIRLASFAQSKIRFLTGLTEEDNCVTIRAAGKQMNDSKRPISPQQIVAVLAATLVLFFLVAFTTKSLDAYRLRTWRDRLQEDIAQMEHQREELQEELRRRQSRAWLEEVLRDAGYLPDDVISVVVYTVTPAPAPQDAAVASPTPTPVPAWSDAWFDNPHWRAWQRLIWGDSSEDR